MIAIAAQLWLGGCAPRLGAQDIVPPQIQDNQLVRFSPKVGPKRKLRIRELAMSSSELKRYPVLASAPVGRGLSRLLVATLADTGRFDLLEDHDQLVQRLSHPWRRTAEGIAAHTPPVEDAEPSAFLFYAKIFDVAVCAPNRQSPDSQGLSICRTSVGVQVRIADAAGRFVPGATHPLSPQGRYVHDKTMPLFGSNLVAFDHSAMGKAVAKAMRFAVLQAIERLERQGW
ncbi:MAG: hypothetical protein OEU26_05825 [Candidatus Tectomicrobia bacterium]|nr:hypothetical protein [Candidatus Tectomicrobia bacterium]